MKKTEIESIDGGYKEEYVMIRNEEIQIQI